MMHAESERESAGPQFPDRGILDKRHMLLRDLARGCRNRVDKKRRSRRPARGVWQGDGYIAELSGNVKSRIASHCVRLDWRELDGSSDSVKAGAMA
jgi:hypothetical protein